MKRTMEKYARLIAENKIDPHICDDGNKSGLLLDPSDDNVPVDLIGFGVYRLSGGQLTRQTYEREMVLVPEAGVFEAEVNGKGFHLERRGGPFAAGPGKSNACALYVPREATLILTGAGEMAFFEAPASEQKTAVFMPPGEVKPASRGSSVWRRDVVTLLTPASGTSNLLVGETYSAPGLWSGMPLHRHDRDEPEAGESDHEEVYYHRLSWKRTEADRFPPYAVQLLADGAQLMKAFVVRDRSIFAIPGGCHPVVASPAAALLYLWGLAGKGRDLAMREAGFSHLKKYEQVFMDLEGATEPRGLGRKRFDDLCTSHSIMRQERDLLVAMLEEKGYRIEE